MIDLRPARMSDTDMLFEWRNDPVTCANSGSTDAVPRSDHERWMQFNVANGYPQHIVLIADTDLGPAGVVRFDAARRDVMTYTASITVAPKHRGKGLSLGILDLACSYMGENTINAMVRSENIASRKIFEACGFEDVGSEHGFITYRRYPLP